MPNSHGKTNAQVRKFLRENGIKPTCANVDRIGTEIRRTEAENRQVERIAKERGMDGTRDKHGPVGPRVREAVQRELRERRRRQ